MNPSIGTCNEFIPGFSERSSASIVIAPIRVMKIIGAQGDDGEKWYWGCSKYSCCHNSSCEYSIKSREERDERKTSTAHAR